MDEEPKTEMLFFRCGVSLFRRVADAAEAERREKSDFLRIATEDYLDRWERTNALIAPTRDALMDQPR